MNCGLGIDDVEVPIGIEADLVRRGEGGCRGGPPVARVALHAVSGDRRELTRVRTETPRAPGVDLAEVQRLVGPDDDAVRIGDRRPERVEAVAVRLVAGPSDPCDRSDPFLLRRRDPRRDRNRERGLQKAAP